MFSLKLKFPLCYNESTHKIEPNTQLFQVETKKKKNQILFGVLGNIKATFRIKPRFGTPPIHLESTRICKYR